LRNSKSFADNKPFSASTAAMAFKEKYNLIVIYLAGESDEACLIKRDCLYGSHSRSTSLIDLQAHPASTTHAGKKFIKRRKTHGIESHEKK
jgi:hypothetical protein